MTNESTQINYIQMRNRKEKKKKSGAGRRASSDVWKRVGGAITVAIDFCSHFPPFLHTKGVKISTLCEMACRQNQAATILVRRVWSMNLCSKVKKKKKKRWKSISLYCQNAFILYITCNARGVILSVSTKNKGRKKKKKETLTIFRSKYALRQFTANCSEHQTRSDMACSLGKWINGQFISKSEGSLS